MRLFSCVEVTNPRLVAALNDVRDEVCRAGKPVPAEKYHVTLKFFGDVSNTESKQIVQQIKQFDAAPFTMHVRGVGVFPKPAYINVVWAGVDEHIEPLVAETRTHFSLKQRYTPHVTLCRFNTLHEQEKRRVQALVERYKDTVFGAQRVEHVVLKQSTLTDTGAVYEDVERVRLQ